MQLFPCFLKWYCPFLGGGLLCCTIEFIGIITSIPSSIAPHSHRLCPIFPTPPCPTLLGQPPLSSSSAASAVREVPPAIHNPVQGAVGAAALLQARASRAAVIATTAANDAAAFSSTHYIIINKHCTMFLQRAFGINPDGAAVDLWIRLYSLIV
jgi:hypothetical protein